MYKPINQLHPSNINKNKFKSNLNTAMKYIMNTVKSIEFKSVAVFKNIANDYNTVIGVSSAYRNYPLFTRNIMDAVEKHWRVDNKLMVEVLMRDDTVHQHIVSLNEFVGEHCKIANINNHYKISAKLVDVLLFILPKEVIPACLKFNVINGDKPITDFITNTEIMTEHVAVLPESTDEEQYIKRFMISLENKTVDTYLTDLVIYLLTESIQQANLSHIRIDYTTTDEDKSNTKLVNVDKVREIANKAVGLSYLLNNLN